MKNILTGLFFVSAVYSGYAQNLIVGQDTISAAEFEKEYAFGLEKKGIKSTVDSYIDFMVVQHFAKTLKVDTTRYYKNLVDKRLNELKKDSFFPKDLQNKSLAQFIKDNKTESKVQIFFLKKADADATKDYKKIYNEVKQGKISMEEAIATYTQQEGAPIFVKAGTFNWTLDQQVQQLPNGGYTPLVENSDYITFVKKLGERPSLGYLVFGTISYPNDANAEAKKDSIYTALATKKNFKEVAAKFGSTKNEKVNGGLVIGSPVLPEDVYAALKALKAGEYTKTPILKGDKWFIFNIYAKRPYDLSSTANREFFMADMMNSEYGSHFYRVFLQSLRDSKAYQESPLAKKLRQSYQNVKDIPSSQKVLYSYAGAQFTVADLKDKIKEHEDKLALLDNAQWEGVFDQINSDFLMQQYALAFEKRPEIQSALKDLTRNLYSTYFYTEYLNQQLAAHPEWFATYYNRHKKDYYKESAARGRVIIPARSSDVAMFKKAIKDKDNWKNLVEEYKSKLTEDDRLMANFQQGDMVKSAEVFQKYKVPFKKGVYTAKIGDKDLIIAIDEILPAGQMSLEEAKESGALKNDLISNLVQKTIKEQKSKLNIVVQPSFIATLEKKFKK